MASSTAAAREYSSQTMSKILTVKHSWSINNFRMCFVRNGDERLSSVFSIDGNDWRMRLQLSSLPYFTFGLDPVDKSKTVQLRGEWKLSIRNGQGISLHQSEKQSILNDSISDYILLGGYLDQKLCNDNVKDGCITLVFEIGILLKDVEAVGKETTCTCTKSELRKKHIDSMMAHGFLSPDTTHSDVELASAEGEMLYAHKHILAAHSPVFAAMFQANMRERNEGRVDIDDLSTSVLVDMLSFMYTGEPPVLTNAADATGLLGAAAKYEIDGLKDFCAEAMPEPTEETVCEMLLTAHLYDAIALKRRAAEFIRKQIATTGSGGFIKSAGWRELCKHPTLVQFLVGEAVNGTGE